MGSTCDLDNISNLSTLPQDFHNGSFSFPEVASSIFYVDGFLCIIFAFLTHLKYTSVSVLNYSVNTSTISNTKWIWFFIFTAISSILNGLDIWIELKENHHTSVPFLTGWIAHLLAVLLLFFAIMDQWKYKEEAFHEISTESERTPILFQQTGTKRPRFTDVCSVALILMSCAFFIAADMKECSTFYWISFGSSWLLRLAIFLLVFVIHYKLSLEGPSILVKCLLLAGVLFNTVCDFPTKFWIECIFHKNHEDKTKAWCYNAIIVLILFSHVLFFVVLRSEYRRLKDIMRWYIANNIDRLEEDSSRLRER